MGEQRSVSEHLIMWQILFTLHGCNPADSLGLSACNWVLNLGLMWFDVFAESDGLQTVVLYCQESHE